jgi:carbon storage regulator CsrA
MLVLTRKANEEILIDENIRITLVRIKGNSVRIGIEAPRDVRVIRGELAEQENVSDDLEAIETETVFAHPQPPIGRHAPKRSKSRLVQSAAEGACDATTTKASAESEPKIFFERVRPVSADRRSRRAPLAEFIAAT